jgi:hypothetical protein
MTIGSGALLVSLGLVVHGPAAALGDPGGRQLLDDLVEGGGVARDGGGDVLVAERAVALAVPGEVQVDHGDVLAADVAPDVELGPVQERVDPDVGAGREAGHVLVPELRRLVLEVPGVARVARAEVALLGPRALLVAADPGDQAVEAVPREGAVQPGGLARRRAGRGRQGRVHLLDGRAGLDEELEAPLLAVAVAEGVHLAELLAGVDVEHRERHVAEERLARQPQHDVAVLAERPQHGEAVQLGVGLAQHVDALRLKDVQMVHAHHLSASRGSASHAGATGKPHTLGAAAANP